MRKAILLFGTILLGFVLLFANPRGNIYSTKALKALEDLIDNEGNVYLHQKVEGEPNDWFRLNNSTHSIELTDGYDADGIGSISYNGDLSFENSLPDTAIVFHNPFFGKPSALYPGYNAYYVFNDAQLSKNYDTMVVFSDFAFNQSTDYVNGIEYNPQGTGTVGETRALYYNPSSLSGVTDIALYLTNKVERAIYQDGTITLQSSKTNENDILFSILDGVGNKKFVVGGYGQVNFTGGFTSLGDSIAYAKITATGGFQINTSGTLPTCDSTTRGLLWLKQSSTGVADTLCICIKTASNNYGWFRVINETTPC